MNNFEKFKQKQDCQLAGFFYKYIFFTKKVMLMTLKSSHGASATKQHLAPINVLKLVAFGLREKHFNP